MEERHEVKMPTTRSKRATLPPLQGAIPKVSVKTKERKKKKKTRNLTNCNREEHPMGSYSMSDSLPAYFSSTPTNWTSCCKDDSHSYTNTAYSDDDTANQGNHVMLKNKSA